MIIIFVEKFITWHPFDRSQPLCYVKPMIHGSTVVLHQWGVLQHNLVFLIGLIMWIGHSKEIWKLTFTALALRWRALSLSTQLIEPNYLDIMVAIKWNSQSVPKACKGCLQFLCINCSWSVTIKALLEENINKW